MSAPDYSMARSRLSVRLPRESLYSSLEASSQYFRFDSETARLAQNANQWLYGNVDNHGVSRPASIAPSNFAVRNIEPMEYDAPFRTKSRRDHPVMGSVRHNGIRPRSVAPTESTEKLRTPSGDDADGTLNEEEIVYPKGLKLGLITLALCLAVFVMALGEHGIICCDL